MEWPAPDSKFDDPMNELWFANRVSEVLCHDCDGPVVEFSIPSDAWNAVMRPDGHEVEGEYICIGCWMEHVVKFIRERKNNGH